MGRDLPRSVLSFDADLSHQLIVIISQLSKDAEDGARRKQAVRSRPSMSEHPESLPFS